MEKWKLEYEWLRVRHFVKKQLGRTDLPDLQVILFLIGIQESNLKKAKFSKEEKVDLMHVATCHLLSLEGYFEYLGKDDQGWPHFKQVGTVPVEGMKAQERLLMECIVQYFKNYEDLISEYEK